MKCADPVQACLNSGATAMGQELKERTASSFSGSILKHKGAGRVGSALGGETHSGWHGGEGYLRRLSQTLARFQMLLENVIGNVR